MIIGNKFKLYLFIVVIVFVKEKLFVKDLIVVLFNIFLIVNKNLEVMMIGKKKEIVVIKCFLKLIDFNFFILYFFCLFI